MDSKTYSRDEVERTVGTAIEQQISGRVSIMTAGEQWTKILQNLPADLVAEALALTLANGRYQPVPLCQCCGR